MFSPSWLWMYSITFSETKWGASWWLWGWLYVTLRWWWRSVVVWMIVCWLCGSVEMTVMRLPWLVTLWCMRRRGGWNREMRISSVLRWITEYLFCLPSYNEADLFLGLSVFGVKNRIGYQLAQFFLILFHSFTSANSVFSAKNSDFRLAISETCSFSEMISSNWCFWREI